MLARRILPVHDINKYTTGIFMYQCINDNIPELFDNFFQRNNIVHGHSTRQASDLHIPYARLDIRKSCLKVHGINLGNNILILVKQSPSLDIFKQWLWNYVIESKSVVQNESVTLSLDSIYYAFRKHTYFFCFFFNVL